MNKILKQIDNGLHWFFVRKKMIVLFLAVYLFSYILQSLFFSSWFASSAEEAPHKTNLVVVLVEQSLYDEISDDIQWYATDYIQQQITNSKALVIPVNVNDTDGLKAPDIVKILENIYMDGIKDQSSSLVGLVMFGDIPLPVVDTNGFLYPSVYPYVDFEDQQFIFDATKGLFVYNNNTKGQAELWHGYINFDDINGYTGFFDKLHQYYSNPSQYAKKQIWYDDFIALKKYYNPEKIPYYVNSFLFAEDIAYKRYNNLMLDMLQGNHNDMIKKIMGGVGAIIDSGASTDTAGFGDIFGDFHNALGDYKDTISDVVDTAISSSGGDGTSVGLDALGANAVPTLLLKHSVKEFLKTYDSLLGTSYMASIIKGNMKASSRWYKTLSGGNLVSAVDSHFEKIEQKDSFILNDFDNNYAPLLKEFNDTLEKALDEKIDSEKYYMDIPMPVSYQLVENENKSRKLPDPDHGVKKKWCEPDVLSPNLYVNYYFGKSAEDIYSAQDFSIFRGTYRNYSYDDLGSLDYDTIQTPIALSENKSSLQKASVGGSLGLFSQQIEANRGFTIDSIQQEEDLYNDEKIHENYKTVCGKYFKILGIPLFCMWQDYQPDEDYDQNGDGEPDMETREEFALRNWGGASSRNLDQNALLQGVYQLMPSYNYRYAWKPIFDMAGSKKVQHAEYPANSYLAMGAYASLIRVADRYGYYPYPSHLDGIKQEGKVTKDYNDVEYFSVYNKTSDQPSASSTQSKRIFVEGPGGVNHIFWDGQLMGGKCGKKGDRYSRQDIYNYRLIDSRVKNISVTDEQIGGQVDVLFQTGSANYANYQKILRALGQVETSLDNLNDLLIVNQSGIKESLQNINDELTNSQQILANFASMNIASISGASAHDIATWTTELQGSVSSSKGSQLYAIASGVNNELLELESQISNLDLGQLSVVLTSFGTNDQFLLDWKNVIENQLAQLKTRYALLRQNYENQIVPLYSQIAPLNTSVLSVLSSKRTAINDLIQSGSVSQGCAIDSPYYDLCESLDAIIGGQLLTFNQVIDDGDDTSLTDVKTKLSEYYTVSFTFPPFNFAGQTLVNFFDVMGNEFSGKQQEFYSQIDGVSAQVQGLNYSDGTSQSGEGMSFSTQDRPIDSPRYITFQGLAGQKLMFIYPDLYQVEVYKEDPDNSNKLLLKSVDEIKGSIIAYLQSIVQSYNQKLQIQLDEKQNYYNSHTIGQTPNAFDMLSSVDSLATPLRSYVLMDENYFVDLLGDQVLSVLAELLHYQNLPWGERQKHDSVVEDMDALRDGFDVNTKVSSVVSDYLKAGNNKGPIISPSYSDDAYEVAYINSDGNDYIGSDGLPDLVKTMQGYLDSYQTKQDAIQGAIKRDTSPVEEQLMAECNIPPNGAVPLFEWFDSFLCWLKVTLEKPISFKIDYSHAQGPVFGNFLEQLRGSFSSYDEQISAYKNDRGSYKDEWKDLLPFIEPDDSLPPDSVEVPNTVSVKENVEYLTVANDLLGEAGNQSTVDEIKETLGADVAQNLQEVLSYTVPKIHIEDPRVDSFSGSFEVSSLRDFGDIELRIKASGGDCLGIPGMSTNLCDDPYDNISFNPFGDKISKSLSLSPQHKAGRTILTFEFCLLDQDDVCVDKTFDINLLPAKIANTGLVLSIASQKILVGATMPLFVDAYDVYGNNVGQSLDNYMLSVDGGVLNFAGVEKTGFTFSKFDRTKFIYHAPDTSGNVAIGLVPVGDGLDGEDLPSVHGNIQVVDGSLKVLYHDSVVDENNPIDFQLPNSLDGYKYIDTNGLQQVDIDNFPKISLSLQDDSGDGLDAWISVSTKRGLIHPGSVKTYKHKTSFVAGTTFWIQDGKLEIYLNPDFVLGTDELIVSIPGRSAIKIPIHIIPADPRVVKLHLDKDFVLAGNNIGGHVEVRDVWGNKIDKPISVIIESLGPVSFSGSDRQVVTLSGGQYDFELSTHKPGGLGYLMAYIDTGIVALTGQGPGSAKLVIQNPILPEKDLNVMYLNLFGTDWGNQWGYSSDYDKKVNKIFADSPKLLATTTQLIDPHKLLKTEMLIDLDAQIKNMAGFDIYLDTNQDSGYSYFVDGVADISLGEKLSGTYIPEVLDSIIQANTFRDGIVSINGEKVFDMYHPFVSEHLSIKLTDQYISGYNSWELSLGDKIIGHMFFDLGQHRLTRKDISLTNSTYDISTGFFGASTNSDDALAIVNTTESFPNNLLAYKSIESSTTIKNFIGFRGDFKNITLFAGGESVGEATLPFGSHFLINFGDPLLKRIENNQNVQHTDFDGGVGKVIISTPDKIILKTIDIDFNNDGLKDLVTVYTDGTIRIRKNYGGEQSFKALQNLMVLGGGIEDVYAGDVDGNGYDDLLVRTTRGDLRVYTNSDGVFDVDGYQVCLNSSVADGDVTDTPSDLSDISQIFFTYMDEELGGDGGGNTEDKTLDIVTNDSRGDIKIFYGGTTNGRANYLSTLKYTCDDQWAVAQQQTGNVKLVKSFGVRLDQDRIVQDESMVHWLGLEKTQTGQNDENAIDDILGSHDTITNTGLSYSDIMNLGPLADMSSFDAQGFVDKKADKFLRLQVSPVDYYPLYESLAPIDIYYVALGYLLPEDPVSIYKQYEDLNGDILQEGDEVLVTTTIHVLKDTRLTYIDKILGPWYLNTDEDGKPEGFTFENTGLLNNNVFYRWDLSSQNGSRDGGNGYQYMIDNLVLHRGDVLKFSYKLRYKASELMTIDVVDKKITSDEALGNATLDKDNYNDIVVKPTDNCAKAMWVFANTVEAHAGYKNYKEYYVDIAKLMAEYAESLQGSNESAMSSFDNAIQNSISNTGASSNPLSGIPGVDTIMETPGVHSLLSGVMDQLLHGSNGAGDFDFNLNLDSISGLLGDKGDSISSKIDSLMKSSCEGFKLNNKKGCKGLPLPFNMDLLSPGEFNAFGCSIADFNGFPIIFAPGTLPNGIPGPPNFLGGVLKGVGDSFIIWPNGGAVPSMIRVYATVTLTMQVGLSVCLGPMAVGNNMPPLVKDLGGNCVVVTMPLPCSKDVPNDGNLGSDTDIPAWMLDANNGGACNSVDAPNILQPEIITHEIVYKSPLELVSHSATNHTASSAVPAGSYFAGMINVEDVPRAWVDPEGNKTFLLDVNGGPFTDNGVDIKIGPGIVNKVVGGMKNGLMSCVVQGWLDKQIKYIFNNLTKMTVSVTFPDVSDLFAGFDHLDTSSLSVLDTHIDCTDTPERADCVLESKKTRDEKNAYIKKIEKAKQNAEKNDIFKKASQIAMNNSLKKSNLQTAASTINNPFDAVAKMFNEVQLVNISTKDIVVKVPMIYGEDLVQYIQQMHGWLETNQKILTEWTNFFKSTISFCMKTDDEWGLPSMDEVKQKVSNGRDGTKEYAELNKQKIAIEAKLSLANADTQSLKKELDQINQQLKKKQTCMGFFAVDANGRSQVSSFIDFETSASELMDSVRKNIQVLEEYKQFPLKIYEWMHVTDRYMSELSSILGSFVGTITRWMNDNAERYASYVDAIVLMLGSIKTWQVLIDLSANRSSKCSTCTTDTYDSYSCKLGFLCPDLPVLPIPPFKIPNVFIDLSHIDLGIDILLPNFKFQPESFILPKLPNLPNPPTIENTLNFDAPLKVQGSFNFDILGKINFDFGNYRLPSIPIFPSPPDLPEIPSFLPTVKLELPVLPPAPEIPDLIPEIKTVIDIADRIGKILCITKGKIGLVSENAIKSKVEQLSQRTYDVPFWDSFDQKSIEHKLVQKQIARLKEKLNNAVSEEERKKYQKLLDIAEAGDAPLKGFDYKIDSFVALHFNFEHVFSYIDSLVQQVNSFSSFGQAIVQNKIDAVSKSGVNFINGLSSSGMDLLQSSLNSGMDIVKKQTSERADKVKDWSQYDKLKGRSDGARSKLDDWTPAEVQCLNNLSEQKIKVLEKGIYEDLNTIRKKCTQSSYNYSGYLDAKAKLLSGLNYLYSYNDSAVDKRTTHDLISLVRKDKKFSMNIDGVNQIYHEAGDVLDAKQKEIQDLENLMANDYGKFIKDVSHNTVSLVANDDSSYKFSTKIADMDPQVLDEISHQEHPGLSYLNIQEGEVNGYLKALATHNFMSLGMTQTEYEHDKSYLQDLKYKIQKVKPLLSSQGGDYKKILLAQAGGAGNSGGGSTIGGTNIDYSQYAKGVFVDGPDGSGNKLNVVLSDTFVKNIGDNYYQLDINNDGKKDVLMWDDHNVYLKYNQQLSHYVGGAVDQADTHYYLLDGGIQSMQDLKDMSVHTNGFVKIRNLWIKLIDNDWEVKNFHLQGQSFDQLKFSWLNSKVAGDMVDGYVIKLNKRVDQFYDAQEGIDTQYVLVLPNNIKDYTGLYVDFEDGVDGLVDDLMTGTIAQVKFYNPQKEKISVILTDMPRNWLYAKIATLSLSSSISRSLFASSQVQNTYTLNSSWSNQIVAGRQIMSDLVGPVPEITLNRILTNEIVSTGIQHEGYLGTHYALQSLWTDNVAVKDMWIEQDGKLLISGSSMSQTGFITLTGLFFTGETNENYIFAARDFNGNESYQEVNLDVVSPTIDVVDINQLTENTADVVAKLSHDMDEGAVLFEKNRYESWQYLSGTNDSVNGGYTLGLGQLVVTGSVYTLGTNLAIYNIAGEVVAEVNPKNGKIFVHSDYQDSVKLRLVFDNHVPRIEIFDTHDQIVLYRVSLPVERIIDFEIKQGELLYKKVSLDNPSFGDFDGGYALVGTDEQALVYVGPDGDMFVPAPYNNSLRGEYDYDDDLDAIVYKVEDEFGHLIFTIKLQEKPFL